VSPTPSPTPTPTPHNQASALLDLLETTCGCHVCSYGGDVVVTWPVTTTPSDELELSLRQQKFELMQILHARRKVAEFQRRLKRLKGQQ